MPRRRGEKRSSDEGERGPDTHDTGIHGCLDPFRQDADLARSDRQRGIQRVTMQHAVTRSRAPRMAPAATGRWASGER
jgi:hypothetical protein